jgi:uncharacterized protein (TIGR03437 family)
VIRWRQRFENDEWQRFGPAFRNAKPGDEYAMFATGLAPSPAGVRVNLTPLSGATVTVPADFAGLIAVGEFQIDFTIPQQFASLPAGNYPITVSVNGVSSPAMINTGQLSPVVLPVQS